MRDYQEVLKVIYTAVEAVNDQFPPERHIALSPESPVYGKQGKLDSLGLVNLIVAVEQEVQDQFGVSISLADEKALSQQHSPFRTIETLAQYVLQAIEGAA